MLLTVSVKEFLNGAKIPEERCNKYASLLIQNGIMKGKLLADKDRKYLSSLGIPSEDADAIITKAFSRGL